MARFKEACSTARSGIPSRLVRTPAVLLALAILSLFPPLRGQVMWPPGYSSEMGVEANPAAYLPARPLTMTVLDALGRPVAGASFSSRYLSTGGGTAPVTDDRGTATLWFRFPLDTSSSVSNLWLSVAHTNHATRTIQWTVPSEQFLSLFPTNYTVRFAAVEPIGGVVRDAAGQAVSGAFVYAMTAPQPTRQGEAKLEFSTYRTEPKSAMVTDAKGAWKVSGFPIDADAVRLVIVRDDGSSSSFGNAGVTNEAPVELADLRSSQAVLTLPEGNTVRGIVVDTSGQPIPGVRLRERNWATYPSSPFIFTNGPDGRFILPHRTASDLQLTVDSPQHLQFSTNLIHRPGMPELRFVLEPARIHPLAMTVLDAANRPVAGARFLGQYLPGQYAPDEVPVTDAQGQATLSFRFPRNASRFSSDFRLYVNHSNHVARIVTWTATHDQLSTVVPTNYTLRFAATEAIGGYVRDHAGRPVAGARIDLQAGDRTYRPGAPSEPGPRESSEFFWRTGIISDTNGFWSLSRVPVDAVQPMIIVRRPTGAVAVFGGSEDAGGLALDPAALRRTNAVLNLPATFTVRGMVVDENGQPIGGVGLRYSNRPMWESYQLTNGSDGRFELPNQSGPRLLLTVDSRRFSYYSTNFDVDISKPEVRLVLPSRLAIRQHLMNVTVLDADGQPVVGATFVGDFRNDQPAGGSPTTDGRGMATLAFRMSEDQPIGSRSISGSTSASGETITVSRSTVRVSVRHSNQVQRAIIWTAPTEKLLSSLPTNYTVRLPGLVTIGGYVRDERGQPADGARLDVRSSGGSSTPNDNTTRTNEVSEFSLGERAAPITDAKGFWSVPQIPADLVELQFLVIRPGGAVSSFVSGSNPSDGIVDIAMLRRSEAVLTVPEGVTIRGRIVDEAGQPVSMVRLRERSRAPGGYHVFTNEADGRFELPHRTSTALQLSVDSPRHSVLATNIPVEPGVEALLVLSRQRPLRLRVVDGDGKPIQRAHVQPMEWRNGGLNYEWSAFTDAEGRVRWTNAPAASVVVMVTGMAPMRRFRLKPSDDEVVLRMERNPAESAVLRMKIVDVGTGQPVPGATVLRTLSYRRVTTEVGKTGSDGRLEVTLGAGNAGEQDQPFNLLVRSEGYLQWLCPESFVVAEGDIDVTAALKKGRAAGVVFDPGGRPASGATVILSRLGNRVSSYRPGEFRVSNSEDKMITSGADGAFEFPPADGEDRLLAVHRTGFAELSVETLGDSGKVNLQPWGRIEGVVTSGGKPLARQRLGLRTPINQSFGDGYTFQYNTTADRSGRFVFTNIPPGEHVLVRHVGSPQAGSMDSHRLPVNVGPGETRQVSYTFGGRNVVGFVDADADVDWTRDIHLLEAKVGRQLPGPEYPGMAGPMQQARIRRAHARSAGVLDYERKRQTFQLTFDADGAFRIEDVAPGTYELRLRALERKSREAETSGRWVEPVEIATLVREIVIPPGASGTEVDLGIIPVEAKGATSRPSKSPPLSFRATAINGRPYEISRERGRPALLVFWADWAPRSNLRLTELSTAVATHVTGTNNALISICLDDDPGPTRQAAQRLGGRWTQVRLDGAERFQITDQLGIDTLPAAFLLDAEGSVIARDPGGRRVAAVLNRLNSQSRP